MNCLNVLIRNTISSAMPKSTSGEASDGRHRSTGEPKKKRIGKKNSDKGIADLKTDNTRTVFDIPQHILPIIKEFLIIKISSYDLDKIMRSNRFYGFNWEENKRSWRCFLSMNRSSYWYDTVRYELFEYNLNRYYSLQFLHQDVFRKNLLSR
jgi:hypothetical protein